MHMLIMTAEEKAAYEWALAEEEGPTCSKVLAEYIKRNALGTANVNNLSPGVQADIDRLLGNE